MRTGFRSGRHDGAVAVFASLYEKDAEACGSLPDFAMATRSAVHSPNRNLRAER